MRHRYEKKFDREILSIYILALEEACMIPRCQYTYILYFAAVLIFFNRMSAQVNTGLSVSLSVDFTAAERMLEYFDRRTSNVESVLTAHGNILAAATSVMLARTSADKADFRNALERVRDNENIQPDIYGLLPARINSTELRKLLTEIKHRQLERRVIATVESFFPSNISLSVTIPVYVVAMGNEKAAAVVRRVQWQGSTPLFVDEGEGVPVIMLNLARSLGVSEKVDEQFIVLLSTLAHEVFHAVYSQWKSTLQDYAQPASPAEALMDLVQNEGVAYYLSMQIRWGDSPMSPQWYSATANAIGTLNKVLRELRSPQLSQSRARELIMNSNLSGSFEGNYGATAGTRMAYEIEAKLGRSALTATLAKGGYEFLKIYREASLRDSSLPQVDAEAPQPNTK
jgi:hypothetical protein